jgi:Uma2 family endonuclease
MPTLVLDPPPAEFQALLERRRRVGADRRDEVWKGVLHMAPAPHYRHARLQWQLALLLDGPARAAGLEPSSEFNLGEPEDYRIPDGGLHRPTPEGLYLPTAAVVIEILSPGDETPDKLPFYATHHVDELVIVDSEQRTVQWLALGEDGSYRQVKRSRIIDLGAEELADRIDWPA